MILRSDQISQRRESRFLHVELYDCTLIATMQRELTKNAPKVALK